MMTTKKWLLKATPTLAALLCLASVNALAQTAAAPGVAHVVSVVTLAVVLVVADFFEAVLIIPFV